MSKLRVVRAEVTTSDNAKLRVVRVEVSTVVAPTSKLRVVRAELETIPAPKLRVVRVEVETDVALIANAGADQHVQSLQRVFLSALASSGDPMPEDFSWSQTAGPPVTLEPSAFVAQPSFVFPATVAGTRCSFVVTADNGVDTPVSSNPVHIDGDPHIHWHGAAGQVRPSLYIAGQVT